MRDCATYSWCRHAWSSCRGGACGAANTSRSSSSTECAKTSEPGRPPHHARRRRPADVDRLLGGRARDAVRVRAAELRQRVREPSLLRSRRRPSDHGLHQRGARPRSASHADGSRLRAPHRVLALAGHVPAGGRAARRARDQAQRRQGPRLHGLDLLRGSARPHDRARVLSLRAARSATRTPRCCSRRTSSASSAATRTSPRSTWRMRSRRSSCDRRRRSPTTDRRRTPTNSGGSDGCEHAEHVIPQAHAELADRLAEQGAGAGCSLDFEGGPGNCGAVAPATKPSFMLTEHPEPPRSSPLLELKVIRRRPRPDEPAAE